MHFAVGLACSLFRNRVVEAAPFNKLAWLESEIVGAWWYTLMATGIGDGDDAGRQCTTVLPDPNGGANVGAASHTRS